MSRSKHTDPDHIRAARRLETPNGRRGEGDLGRARKVRRSLKESGIGISGNVPTSKTRRVWPRILVQPPRAGFHHPAGKRDVLAYLKALGAVARYGLRTVELMRAPAARGENVLRFGRYETPGRVILYEQPSGVWRLESKVTRQVARWLRRKGADVINGSKETTVEWPEDTLRRFMLEGVLSHEIGHHVLQQYTGKRAVRVARKRDHEHFATRFAAKHGGSKIEGKKG